MALFLDLDPGDEVSIGTGTKLTIERKSGGRTRVRVDSDYTVRVERGQAVPRPQASTKTEPKDTGAAWKSRAPTLRGS